MSQIKDISTEKTAVLITTIFPQFTPQQLYNHFTMPHLIAQWWPQSAEMDVQVGGKYELGWPMMGWTLRGEYTAVSAPSHLTFTWQWDHQPDLPIRTVDIQISPAEQGSKLLLQHGTYGDSDTEQEDRQSHIDGWLHFLQQLSELA